MEHNGSTTGKFETTNGMDYYNVAQPNGGVVSNFYSALVNVVKYVIKRK